MLNYNELAGIKRRDFYRGRAIYREFERKYDHDDFANDEEYYLRLKRSKHHTMPYTEEEFSLSLSEMAFLSAKENDDAARCGLCAVLVALGQHLIINTLGERHHSLLFSLSLQPTSVGLHVISVCHAMSAFDLYTRLFLTVQRYEEIRESGVKCGELWRKP